MTNNHASVLAGTVLQAHTITGGLHLHTARHPELVPVPRQLPAPRVFLDRDQARAFLDKAWVTRLGPMRVGVEGPAGIGKTALITEWGHHHRDRWTDGALYADLARSTADNALRGWLAALGHTYLPEDPDQLRALWRTTTATRRLLVIIEHATAHHGLPELVATGARYARLAALPNHAVGELITRLTDCPVPPSVLQEAVAATRGVPLAATLTAAVLTRDLHTPLTETTQESVVPDRVTQLLSEFPEQTATAAAVLAAFPGPSVTADLAAALWDTSTDEAHRTLRELVDAALLVHLGQGRYTVHDQVRAPLTNRLTPTLRTRVVDQLADFYRVRVAAVDLVLNPWRWRADTQGVELARAAQQRGPWFASRDHALAWMDAELDNLLAVSRMFHQHGRPEVWMLVDHIGTYVVLRKPAVRGLYEWGVESARTTGDGRALNGRRKIFEKLVSRLGA